jgi:excisionase family DNA binding protein
MAAVGNLNDYVKFQMAEGMGRGGGGPAGMATEMAVGLAIAQQMMQQQGGPLGPSATPVAGDSATSVAQALPDLLSPGEVAQALGVSEGDVVTILESGELKGKRIGSTYRIKRSALDEYLAD